MCKMQIYTPPSITLQPRLCAFWDGWTLCHYNGCELLFPVILFYPSKLVDLEL